MSACQGYISGRVYVDENNNNLADSVESGISGTKITVMFNQERINEVTTNGSGSFKVKAGRLGRYCLSLDSDSLEAAVSGANFGRAMRAVGTSFPNNPFSGQPAGNQQSGTPCADMNGDGRCDSGCTDSNRDGVCDSDCLDANHDGRCDEQCVDSNNDGRCENNCVDANRDGSCDADRCVDANNDGRCDAQSGTAQNNNAPQPPAWTQGGYCFTNSNYVTQVDIPVRIDYSGADATASVPPPRTCRAGSSCEITIPIPRGCELNSLILPEGLSMGSAPVRTTSAFSGTNMSSTTGDDRTFSDTQSNSGRSSAPIVTPVLESQTITLEVSEDIAAGTTTSTLTPTADCGAEDITLSAITLNLAREVRAVVSLNLVNNPEAGRDIDVDATIENTGDGAISSGELTIEIPDGTSIVSVGRECNNLGNRMLCQVRSLAATGQMTATLGIRLPSSPAEGATFIISAIFSSDEFEDDITAAPIEFALSSAEPASPPAPTPVPTAPAQSERPRAYLNPNVFYIAR